MEDYKIIKIVNNIRLRGGLTEEEVVHYFKQLEKDKQKNVPLDESEARAILILAFDDFIWFIVKRKFKEMDEDEAYIEGLIGLIKAVDTYSLDKKIKFITYAGACIKHEILQKIRSYETLKHKHSEISIYEEIANAEDIPLVDTLADDEDLVSEVADLDLINRNFKVIEKYFRYLNKTEQFTLIFSFGLYNQPMLKQKDIAKICGVQSPTISRAYRSTMRKLYIFTKSKEELTPEEYSERQVYILRKYELVNLDNISNKVAIFFNKV